MSFSEVRYLKFRCSIVMLRWKLWLLFMCLMKFIILSVVSRWNIVECGIFRWCVSFGVDRMWFLWLNLYRRCRLCLRFGMMYFFCMFFEMRLLFICFGV